MNKLPLAAKVVGNQLRQQPNIRFWQATLANVNLSNIMEILLWSFRRLDVQLQRCFLFCSVFPKGIIFSNNVVPYWVALDFIQPSNDNRSVEDIGSEYFEIMKANSIFHLVDNKYVMHDLFHDLAEELSFGDCFRVTKTEREIPSTVQHIWLEVNNENLKENVYSIRNLSNLRTFILGNPFIDDISEIIEEISTNFRNLRVLEVQSMGYNTLPRAIGDLRNLRFTLPTKLTNFIKLRCIKQYNSDGSQVKTLPPVPYLGKLTSLQSLNEFHVSKEKGFELQQLEPLKEIRGSLRIVNLENVRDKNEAGQELDM
ncbi:putative disease resistance protein At3g14460 [Carex rostrata]